MAPGNAACNKRITLNVDSLYFHAVKRQVVVALEPASVDQLQANLDMSCLMPNILRNLREVANL